jgi:hypothetical protein
VHERCEQIMFSIVGEHRQTERNAACQKKGSIVRASIVKHACGVTKRLGHEVARSHTSTATTPCAHHDLITPHLDFAVPVYHTKTSTTNWTLLDDLCIQSATEKKRNLNLLRVNRQTDRCAKTCLASIVRDAASLRNQSPILSSP